MRSPELYSVKKIELNELIKNNYIINISNSKADIKKYYIKQQYNQLFRIIRNIKPSKLRVIDEVLFVSCTSYKGKEDILRNILKNDCITINGVKYRYYGKSASMSRAGTLGFISEDIYEEVDRIAMMGLNINKTVLSKFEAYKNLLFSSCFCIEKKLPYMIVVPDFEKDIKNVSIKYVSEVERTYNDKITNEKKVFIEKIIKEGVKDVTINTNDGAGLCSIEWAESMRSTLKIPYTPCVYMLRLPYVKGITISFDIKNFYKERGVEYITDSWGKKHKVSDIDIILTESQYKGKKYFKNTGGYEDWEQYLNKIDEYGHCLGISKWNFSHAREPKKTRCNYQILQDLSLKSEDIIDMSKYTRNWIEKILDGDFVYTLNYLGINEKLKLSNKYMQSIALNSDMLKDVKVRNYIYGLLEKTINELKIGKFYLNGAFKIITPDLVFMAEYIGGIEPVGVLCEGEMYAKEHIGDYVLNRNPHICKSEHVILNAINNSYVNKWCGHLENVCMVSSYDVTAPRLNGCDFDGDLVFVHNDSIFMKGVIKDLPIVMDIEDKVTALEKEYNVDNMIEYTLDSLDSRIGEISNLASSYHNKTSDREEIVKKYQDFTCLLSVINGKEIDKAKTGVRWNVPPMVSKGGRPLPYFMKYKYPQLTTFSKSHSIMNKHCWFIEKWQKSIKYNSEFVNTSHCMINNDIPFDEFKYNKVRSIYNSFKKEFKGLKNQEKMSKDYDSYKDFWSGISKKELEMTEIDWNGVYDKYKKKLEEVVPNQSELANYVIDLTYNVDCGKYYVFAWNVCDEGILTNLRVNKKEPLMLPRETTREDGIEYLGKYYKLVEYNGVV